MTIPTQDAADAAHAPQGSTGEQELAALSRRQADKERTLALAQVLVNRAAAHPEFGQALQGWWDQAAPVRGTVTNTINGNVMYGNVFQAQNFSGLTFGAQPVPPTAPPAAQSS